MCSVNVQLSLHENVVFFVWAMPRILYLSCGIQFLILTPGIISGLTSVVMWLSQGEVIKKNSGYLLGRGEGGKLFLEWRTNF